MDVPLSEKYRIVRRLLAEHFNESELRDTCFDIGSDYDSLPGQNKNDKARELIRYCERNQRISQLLEVCRYTRPHLNWPIIDDISSDSEQKTLASQYFSEGLRALIMDDLWEARRNFSRTLDEDPFHPRAAEELHKVERIVLEGPSSPGSYSSGDVISSDDTINKNRSQKRSCFSILLSALLGAFLSIPIVILIFTKNDTVIALILGSILAIYILYSLIIRWRNRNKS